MALDLAAVASGAAIGGALRHAIASSPRVSARPNGRLWAIGAINVAGSALLAGVACCAPLQPRARLLLGTGLCGGFTTFSTFAVDIVGLLETRQYATAAASLAGAPPGPPSLPRTTPCQPPWPAGCRSRSASRTPAGSQ